MRHVMNCSFPSSSPSPPPPPVTTTTTTTTTTNTVLLLLGLYNLCKDMKFFATPPYHGSLARSVVHPADFCFKLPDNVSLEEVSGAIVVVVAVGRWSGGRRR